MLQYLGTHDTPEGDVHPDGAAVKTEVGGREEPGARE